MADTSALTMLLQIQSLLDGVWHINDTAMSDEVNKRLAEASLDQVATLLTAVKQQMSDLEKELEARTAQGKKAAAKVRQLKDDMQQWKDREDLDKYVKALIEDVADHTIEGYREETWLTVKMNIEQKVTMAVYEQLDDVEGYLNRQHLAANVAAWLANFENLGDVITTEQAVALRRLAEAVNGVWLDE